MRDGWEKRRLKLSDVITDAGTQVRERLDLVALAGYEEIYREGGELGPLFAAQGPKGQMWLVDGFHRKEAMSRAGIDEADFLVWQVSSFHEAQGLALESNKHGVPLTYKDRTRKLILALANPLYKDLPTRAMAAMIGCSNAHVSKVTKKLNGNIDPMLDGRSKGGRSKEREDNLAQIANDQRRSAGKPPEGEDFLPVPPDSPDSPETDNEIPPHLQDIFADRHLQNNLSMVANVLAKVKSAGASLDVAKAIRDLSQRISFYPWLCTLGKFKTLCDCLKGLRECIDTAVDHAEQAEGILTHSLPHCVCPKCLGKNPVGWTCLFCEDNGFVPRWRLDVPNAHLLGPVESDELDA